MLQPDAQGLSQPFCEVSKGCIANWQGYSNHLPGDVLDNYRLTFVITLQSKRAARTARGMLFRLLAGRDVWSRAGCTQEAILRTTAAMNFKTEGRTIMNGSIDSLMTQYNENDFRGLIISFKASRESKRPHWHPPFMICSL